MTNFNINPELDLYFERIVDVPPALVWKAWTVPEHMLPWFCPLPWKTVECEVDLRPGGKFYTVMQSPEGQKIPQYGLLFRGCGEYATDLDKRASAWLSPCAGVCSAARTRMRGVLVYGEHYVGKIR